LLINRWTFGMAHSESKRWSSVRTSTMSGWLEDLEATSPTAETGARPRMPVLERMTRRPKAPLHRYLAPAFVQTASSPPSFITEVMCPDKSR
jgi:hypothetical protein